MEQQNAEQGATGDAPEAPNHSPDEQAAAGESTADSSTADSPEGNSSTADAAEVDAAELSARVQELEERAQRYLANWQRAQADLQNFRRQVERDQEEMAQWASAALMQQTLSVLDDLERAFSTVPANLISLTWIEGVWLVYKKLEAMLVARGLEALEVEVGQTFDPNLHQAITEVDGVAGAVVEVVQRGYTVGGRLLRPALVTVGNGNVVAAGDGEDAGDGDSPPAAEGESPEAEADSAQ